VSAALWRLAALGLAALLALPAHAGEVHGFRFHIVTGDDSVQTRRIADDLYQRLVPLSAMFRTELAQRRRMVYIAIGPVALRDVAHRKDDCVVISAFTSSQVWRAVAAGATPARAAAMTAVYAEPAPADQLRLIALLYRRHVAVAAIIGAGSGHLKPVLRGSAAVEEMAPGDDINRILNRIAPNEVLLAMPDSAVYNAENLRNILLSTYRHKQGVIGFSADMVKAGALASTYSGIEDINAQVAEMAAAFVASGELGPPQFPRYFSTIVNEGVARSLDIEVGDAARKFAHRPPARPR
jgi:ABC-type uncharacterized transport system substrate-binding protein